MASKYKQAQRDEALVIVVGHEKGGVGKSTIAINLAYALQAMQRDVLVIDTDTTATTTAWRVNRKSRGGSDVVTVVQEVRDPLGLIQTMAKRYDVIVVDLGARDYDKLEPLAKICDLFIAPCGVGQAEIEATAHLHRAFSEINRRHKSGDRIPLVTVINMVPTRGTVEEETAKETLLQALPDLRLLDGALRNRRVYRDAHKLGQSIFERPKSEAEQAVAEFTRFIQEALAPLSSAA